MCEYYSLTCVAHGRKFRSIDKRLVFTHKSTEHPCMSIKTSSAHAVTIDRHLQFGGFTAEGVT